jgi:hypothetical protein
MKNKPPAPLKKRRQALDRLAEDLAKGKPVSVPVRLFNRHTFRDSGLPDYGKARDKAQAFQEWLVNNQGDPACGCPQLEDFTEVSKTEFIVVYSCETDFAAGVVAGIDL